MKLLLLILFIAGLILAPVLTFGIAVIVIPLAIIFWILGRIPSAIWVIVGVVGFIWLLSQSM